MGDGCSPKNLAAILMAKAQATGRDIFSEAHRVNQMDVESRAYYERFMAQNFGIDHRKPGRSGWDILSKKGLAEKPSLVDDRLYANPSKLFSDRFYGALNRRLTNWSKGKDTSRQSYDKAIGKPVGEVLDAINKVVEETHSVGQLNTKLKPFGLNAETVYDARDYLKWLKDGGHLRSQGEAQPFVKVGNSIAKAQANMNLKWTLGNGVDMIRVGSHYITRPGGIRNTIKGLYDAAAATKMNPFKRIESLEKKGVYGSQYVDQGGANLNPFEWSITAQKNIVYHLDKAAGGDGFQGIRDTLFDSQPWDRPRYDRFEGSALVNGLARYGINETRWLYKTSKAALSGNVREGANLGLYFLGRAAFTGTASIVPSFLWQAMPQEMRDSIEELEQSTGANLIKTGSRAVFQAMGMEAEIDLTDYLQPTVPDLGNRAGSLFQQANTALKSGAKTVANAAQGNIPAAAINAAATGLALANFGMLGGVLGKLGKEAGAVGTAVENSPWNSTTITKLMNVTAKQLETEFNFDLYKVNVLRGAFGQEVRKTENSDKPDSLPKLPALPKLQSLN